MRRPEDFWARVERTRGCWLWAGKDGDYPSVRWRGKRMRAHRVAYELATGSPAPPRRNGPGTPVVMHACDNTRCVNPSHLTLGTQSENKAQSFSRGRSRAVLRLKLTAEQVQEIRSAWADGKSQNELAMAYGVTQANISHIVRGKTWR